MIVISFIYDCYLECDDFLIAALPAIGSPTFGQANNAFQSLASGYTSSTNLDPLDPTMVRIYLCSNFEGRKSTQISVECFLFHT